MAAIGTRMAMALLAQLDPERAHGIALAALRLGLAGQESAADDPILATEAFGLRFANPLGLAAGFDKDAAVILPLMRLGFGFVEAGGVTPRAQPGNPRPRLFRLAADRAAINRMGMNGRGIEAFVARLKALGARASVLGVNIAINKEGADPVRDYPSLVAAVAPYADYVALNVSSPNTPGLRDLQGGEALAAILRAIAARVEKRPPLLVKIAPDLQDDALARLIETAIAGGAAGLIVGNTTTSRPPGLRSARAGEAGGLSGAPLFALSTAILARAYRLAAGRLTLIGCGGVSSGGEALAKIRAGASLVQLYTAFAYEGPPIVPRIKSELAAALRAAGFASVRAAVGTAEERGRGTNEA
jgi:dihydroorotate dehydrogenase